MIAPEHPVPQRCQLVRSQGWSWLREILEEFDFPQAYAYKYSTNRMALLDPRNSTHLETLKLRPINHKSNMDPSLDQDPSKICLLHGLYRGIRVVSTPGVGVTGVAILAIFLESRQE